MLDEVKIPINEGVRAACEILGYDPLYLANEGKLVAFVAPEDTKKVLQKMKQSKYGKGSKIIGEVTCKSSGQVYLKTKIGGKRIVDMLTGEQLPRIC